MIQRQVKRYSSRCIIHRVEWQVERYLASDDWRSEATQSDRESSALTDNELSGLESPISLDLSSPTTPLRTPLARLPDRNATLRASDRNLFILAQSISSDNTFDSDRADSPLPIQHPPIGRKRRVKKERDLSLSTSQSADDELDDENEEDDALEALERVKDELKLEAGSEDGDVSDSLGSQVELGPPGHTPPPSRMSRKGSTTPPHTSKSFGSKSTRSPLLVSPFGRTMMTLSPRSNTLTIDKEASELHTLPVQAISDSPPVEDHESRTPGPVSFNRPLPMVEPAGEPTEHSLADNLASALSSNLFGTPERPSLTSLPPSDDDAQVAHYTSLLKNLSSPSRQPTDPFDDPPLSVPAERTADSDGEDSKRARSVFAKLEGLHPQNFIPTVPVITAKVPGVPKLDVEGWRAARDEDPDSWCCKFFAF